MIESTLVEKIDEVVNNYEVNNYLKEYLLKLNKIPGVNNSVIVTIIESFKGLEELNWNTLCRQLTVCKGIPKKIFEFYKCLNLRGYNWGEYDEYIKKNNYVLESKNYSKNLYFEGSIPENIYILEAENRDIKIYINTKSNIIRKVLKDFLNSLSKIKIFKSDLRVFCEFFEESLKEDDIENFNIKSFNSNIFKRQFDFFYEKELIPVLKQFYIYLITSKKIDIFDIKSGINKDFLSKDNFKQLYKEGFRVIYLNKYDPIPTLDKWVLSPNGYEKYTTTMKENDFLILDFSRVESVEIKKYLKEWAIYKVKSMKSLKGSMNNLFLYFEFCKNIDKNKILKIKDDHYKDSLIKKNEVIMFLKYIKDKGYKQYTLNGYSAALAKFINYLIERDEKIDPMIKTFLKIKKPKELKGQIIDKKDFKKIFDNLLSNIEVSEFNKLMYIYIYILATTNFRTSEIINLNRDCIIETMKKGDFKIVSRNKIMMTTKTSGGEKVEVNPSERCIELIKMAIKITEPIKERAPENIKKYIFIEKKNNGNIGTISKDRFYRAFKKLLKEIGIEKNYTLYDFRHTYMTNLFENCDINVALIASGHKDINTTIKHYIHTEIKDYLEAIYKVNIGNIKVNGSIVENLYDKYDKKDLKEITVKDGCGYCNGSCIDNDKIDCLICKSFIVTVNRAPYLKRKIEQIDELIKKENLIHDKEHLVSIKKLYVAYLGEIFNLEKEKRDEKK